MSHAVWCQVCPRPAVCTECGADYYGASTEAANACCRD